MFSRRQLRTRSRLGIAWLQNLKASSVQAALSAGVGSARTEWETITTASVNASMSILSIETPPYVRSQIRSWIDYRSCCLPPPPVERPSFQTMGITAGRSWRAAMSTLRRRNTARSQDAGQRDCLARAAGACVQRRWRRRRRRFEYNESPRKYRSNMSFNGPIEIGGFFVASLPQRVLQSSTPR